MKNKILRIIYFLVNLGIVSIMCFDEKNVRSKTSNVIPLSKNVTNVIPVKIGSILTNKRNQVAIDKLRQEFPNCPMSCEESWIKDGWCDKECYSEDCGNDGGDCVGWCAPECRPSWLGDGQCDIDCFNSKCNWDKNDCNGSDFEKRKKIMLMIERMNEMNHTDLEFDYSNCKCDKQLLGNNICDIECNKIECNMDKGDCLHRCNSRCINTWLGDGQCDPSCDNEECFFDKGDCKSCSENCRTWMIGNGICDKSCNNRDCSYDGGDCSNVCSVSKVDYLHQPLIYKFCLKSWVGDGYCDEDCNNKDCDYDKGDCDLEKRGEFNDISKNESIYKNSDNSNCSSIILNNILTDEIITNNTPATTRTIIPSVNFVNRIQQSTSSESITTTTTALISEIIPTIILINGTSLQNTVSNSITTTTTKRIKMTAPTTFTNGILQNSFSTITTTITVTSTLNPINNLYSYNITNFPTLSTDITMQNSITQPILMKHSNKVSQKSNIEEVQYNTTEKRIINSETSINTIKTNIPLITEETKIDTVNYNSNIFDSDNNSNTFVNLNTIKPNQNQIYPNYNNQNNFNTSNGSIKFNRQYYYTQNLQGNYTSLTNSNNNFLIHNNGNNLYGNYYNQQYYNQYNYVQENYSNNQRTRRNNNSGNSAFRIFNRRA